MNLLQIAKEPRLTVVQMAGSLPRDPMFREWVQSQHFNTWRMTEHDLAWFIRLVCGVTSRRELATDTEAAQRFHDLIRKPYTVWRESQQQPA